MRSLPRFVSCQLHSLSDPVKAKDMADYMKTDMPFYGVQSKDRRTIAAKAKARYPVKSRSEYEKAIFALWELPHREEKYIAIALARSHKTFVSHQSLPIYERMIREGAWWDFVDEIAQHLVGEAIAKDPARVWPVLDRWIQDRDLWMRRTAILCQNLRRQDTDSRRLFLYCLQCAQEQDFFVRKAIGWALRQYARTAPDTVRDFLSAHESEFSPLTLREASKHL